MTSVEYELTRKKRPDLALPAWRDLVRADQRGAKRMWPDELVARRTAVLLRREQGVVDRVDLSAAPWSNPFADHERPV